MRYKFGGLTFGGAYTWRGLFSEFYGILTPKRELIQYDSPTCIADSVLDRPVDIVVKNNGVTKTVLMTTSQTN